MKPAPITVVVDTREQRPWEFTPQRIVTVRRALPAGDYSIDGHDTRIAIERKSIDDYVRSIIGERDRFIREIKLLATYDFAAVVVEAGWADVLAGRYTGGVKPASVVGATVAIMVAGVAVFFAGDRPGARRVAEELLLRWHHRVSSDAVGTQAERARRLLTRLPARRIAEAGRAIGAVVGQAQNPPPLGAADGSLNEFAWSDLRDVNNTAAELGRLVERALVNVTAEKP